MNCTISNESLTVSVSTMGGELQSVKDKGGHEYLWQGDPKYWDMRAINIFPYVARLTQGKYTFNGKTYSMDSHGFVYKSDLSVAKNTENSLTLSLESNSQTRCEYPFEFKYSIEYTLKGNVLETVYRVENKSDCTMYFAVGGHPGFIAPMEDNQAFDDYYLEFAHSCKPVRIGFTEKCFLNGEDKAYTLENDKKLRLTHSLFDDDAVVLKFMDKKVTLKSDSSHRSVSVEYGKMDYLGIWHMPRTDAPYVCIEPWTSLPSRQDIVEDLSEQANLISLKSGEAYENMWKIIIE